MKGTDAVGRIVLRILFYLSQGSLKMTSAGTHTIISRVVVIRYLGGLLCAVGPWFLSLTFLGYILRRAEL